MTGVESEGVEQSFDVTGTEELPAEVGTALLSAVHASPVGTPPPVTQPARRRSKQKKLTVSTPADALLHTEAQRTGTMSAFGVAVSAVVAVGLLLIPADPIAGTVHLLGMGFAFLGSLFVLLQLRLRQVVYSPAYSVFLGLVCAVGAASGFYFWGVFSGVIIVVPIGALLLGQSRHRMGVVAIGGAFLLSHAALSLLTIFGIIDDRAINPIGDRPVLAHLARLFITQAIMFASFLVARRIRHSAMRTLSELEAALRALAQRDALLSEAARERDEALLINLPGRYSGQSIGNYHLGVVIGRGAMGVVYEATNTETGRPAAVKLLHPHILANPDQFRRFALELRTAASLRDPHIVQVYDAPIDDSFPYMAMERLTGASLGDYLAEHNCLSVHETLELIRQIGSGLEAAHAAGIVHRDLKPRNVFRLSPELEGVRWKILDFGTCKDVERDASLTEFGRVIGTPAYMAPEQARGARVDYRADLYALAAIAYRALTGRPPFAERQVPKLLQDVVYEMPPRPSALQPLKDDIDRVFAIALAKQPYDRFQTAEEFARALEIAARGELTAELRERGTRLSEKTPWAAVTLR